MSKENNNLRLLGSPVNLSYRGKKKDDKRNIRNRPRSALQNTVCITPDQPERYKRPFSADTKDRAPSTRSFLKAFSAELLQSYNNSPTTVKIVAPTTNLLRDTNAIEAHSYKNKDICSNASDYGSEDTFISLGTKIKAKAQSGSKKNNSKNFAKYRNIAKKSRKPMENTISEDHVTSQEYGLEVKIIERGQSPTRNKNIFHGRCLSPSFKTRAYESYFIPLDSEKKEGELGQRSYSDTSIQSEVEKAIDTYSRRLTVSKQQLSLVEEESTQDCESVPSQHMSSLSPEMSLEDKINNGDRNENHAARNNYVADFKQSYMSDPRTYTSFYDDFRKNPVDSYKNKLSSTIVHTDSSSKDSGYPDSGPNDDRFYGQNYSLPNTSILKQSSSHGKVEEQPKSLDSVSTTSNDKGYHTSFPSDKKGQWAEPLNHSRLLYKDFFLKKEGHIALPPQNSPSKRDIPVPGSSEGTDEIKSDNTDSNLDYPPYLINSSTKAYTSKVIEDYKKELEAINNLHDLTIKDIKTDAVSPTPLNIDKMFEDASNFDDNKDTSESSQESNLTEQPVVKNKNSLLTKPDVSKISTKELIQNYLKVKEGDYSNTTKPKKPERKVNNASSGESSLGYKQEWNNKISNKSGHKSPVPVNIRNQTHKNMYTIKTPISARIESVQNDKDIDSWMSLSAPSPRILEIDETEDKPLQSEPSKPKDKVEPVGPSSPVRTEEKESKTPKELSSQSSVFDIYSMLKEIESYGENPVTAVTNKILSEPETKKEEENFSPKDNFMEIFEFLEKVEQSANDALSVVTNTTPQTMPKLETLLKLPQTELAQRLVTASLQLEERSCCIALLQESLANHKEQMINKVSNLEKQSIRNINKVKQECEDTIKRHQNFIDQLINDKKTLNHRIEQLVDERRALEERWKRSAQALEERYKLELRNQHDKMQAAQQVGTSLLALEERYKLELRNQHDKMQAAQQVARQRWVRQKAEKIKELTVKGLEGELREMAERQQKEVSDLKMSHAEHSGRMQAKHAQELEELRRMLEEEKEAALVKERHIASSR
ncbi:hypothetical protein PYW07_004350 [Mythimna separata]|uniref:Centrosomal protein of 131 kDa n=1 Tax=Mythimna separata TaxID=271217 RepID=A0AAD8DXZ6_MYTSE|nr:hypothetical protein PYW07_004350 [Mythimna separata]